MGREHTSSEAAAGCAGATSASARVLPAVLMVPGTLCDARLFAQHKRALRGLADVRVVGYAGLRPTGDWAGKLLAQLPERFSLVGFSLGGLWALELMRRAPQRVERLAMVASNAHGASPAGRRKSAHLWRTWRVFGPTAVVRQVEPAYFHQQRQRQRHAPLVLDMARHTGRQAARAQFDWAASRPDGRAALARFAGPLLIVSGAQDRLCPPAMQRAMVQAQPSARWLELPRVGHFVPLEARAQLGDALRLWLAQPAATPDSPPVPL